MEKSEMLECIINYYTDGNKARFAAIDRERRIVTVTRVQ